MSSEHWRRLESMYHAAACNQADRPRLAISDGAATVTMDVRPENFHAAKALHGALYFKMLDDSAFFAAASLIPDVLVLTVSFNIYLVRPVTRGTLRAVASVMSSTKNLSVAESTLYNEDEVVIAHGSGSFMKTGIALETIETYR